jgi:hypothetical protein
MTASRDDGRARKPSHAAARRVGVCNNVESFDDNVSNLTAAKAATQTIPIAFSARC